MIDRQRLYELSVWNINLMADDIRDSREQFVSKSARRGLMAAVNAHRDAFPDLVSEHGV